MVIHAFVVASFEVQRTVPSRRLAAARGFLYIADYEPGLLRYGTGLCGTLFGHVVDRSAGLRGQRVSSLAVTDNYVIAQVAHSSDIRTYLTADFRKHMTITDGPKGYFTVTENEVLFLDGHVLSAVPMVNGQFRRPTRIVELQAYEDWSPGHETTQLLTEGIRLYILQHMDNDKMFIFSLTTGVGVGSKIWMEKQMAITYDGLSQRSHESSNWETIRLHTIKEAIRFHAGLSSLSLQEDDDIVAFGWHVCTSCINLLAQPKMEFPFTLDATSVSVLGSFVLKLQADFADVAVLLLALALKGHDGPPRECRSGCPATSRTEFFREHRATPGADSAGQKQTVRVLWVMGGSRRSVVSAGDRYSLLARLLRRHAVAGTRALCEGTRGKARR
jgi:hypothetical protein